MASEMFDEDEIRQLREAEKRWMEQIQEATEEEDIHPKTLKIELDDE